MHIVASSPYVVTGVAIEGGRTLISVYLDDLTIMCTRAGLAMLLQSHGGEQQLASCHV